MQTKIFDPADGFAPLADLSEITDATLVKRDDRWWMFAAGQLKGQSETDLFSASLPVEAPLSATGWVLTADEKDPEKIAKLAGRELSGRWDLKGGRHCPAYVKGWDPHQGVWVERIYYAGAAQNLWGPYTIGYLEWNGSAWVDQAEPVFVACEPWERGSVGAYTNRMLYMQTGSGRCGMLPVPTTKIILYMDLPRVMTAGADGASTRYSPRLKLKSSISVL